MADLSRMEESDGVLTVTIDRQEKRNAISPAITMLLWEAVEALRDRDDLRVLVVRAVGDYFTAGIDLSAGGRGADAVSGTQYRRDYRRHHLLYDEMEAVEKPVVIAVQGRCLGAGLEMALSCDFRLAAEVSSFALPEITLAVIPGSGGISRLTRVVGPHWARWLAWAGQEVSAEQALGIGLVHQLHAVEDLHASADEFARHLAALPVEASAAAKLVIEVAADSDRASARQVERLANTSLVFGAEHRQAVARFRTERSDSQPRS